MNRRKRQGSIMREKEKFLLILDLDLP